jgi:arylformamidase
MKLFDVTVPLSSSLPTYPGNPRFEMQPVQRIAEGANANVSRVVLGTHSGTHVDAPRHFFDEAAGVDALPLDLLTGPARVLDLEGRQAIGVEALAHADLAGETRVLLRTSNSGFWGSPAFREDFAHLTGEGARYLVERGARLVGIDYLSIERFKAPGAPAHHALLGAGAVIIEGLDLHAVAAGRYELYCLPLALAGADGAPARVILRGPLER